MIATALKRIQTEGSDGNFVIFETATYYIQFTGENGKTSLYAEAVSNQFLSRKDSLSMEQITQLQLMGWTIQDGSNFSRTWEASSDSDREHIAQAVMQAFAVYGVSSENELQVNVMLE
jgi:hypothetical protein